MRAFELPWMHQEEYLQTDNRCAVPLGSSEQHGYPSLGVDTILTERVAAEAAGPLGNSLQRLWTPAAPEGVAHSLPDR